MKRLNFLLLVVFVISFFNSSLSAQGRLLPILKPGMSSYSTLDSVAGIVVSAAEWGVRMDRVNVLDLEDEPYDFYFFVYTTDGTDLFEEKDLDQQRDVDPLNDVRGWQLIGYEVIRGMDNSPVGISPLFSIYMGPSLKRKEIFDWYCGVF